MISAELYRVAEIRIGIYALCVVQYLSKFDGVLDLECNCSSSTVTGCDYL